VKDREDVYAKVKRVLEEEENDEVKSKYILYSLDEWAIILCLQRKKKIQQLFQYQVVYHLQVEQ